MTNSANLKGLSSAEGNNPLFIVFNIG